ncbi:ABC-2 transporter permease [Gorillibacterium sp. sgz5001074]|uniref:ABC-2 transporter permease n=1 Tax=Gorillibacterium sp. sgz5001074 TaxID=3446695 RepID=UPI003F661A31
MYNLLIKELKIGVHWLNFVLPLLYGALMLIPNWIYLIAMMYFFWITMPNLFAQYRAKNDMLFTAILPVTKKDMVKARISVIVILECLQIVVAMIFGFFTFRLYPHTDYVFFAPHMGFWGLCLIMFALYNLILFPMFYKTAYKYGPAQITAITVVLTFATLIQWVGIANAKVSDFFNGSGHTALHGAILAGGIAFYLVFTWIAYRISVHRFQRVEIQ